MHELPEHKKNNATPRPAKGTVNRKRKDGTTFFQPRPQQDTIQRAGQEADTVAHNISDNTSAGIIQKKASASTMPEVTPEVQTEIQRSGQPLPEELKADMESHMGHDFAGVKIHTGPAAAESAESIKANAYTAGNEIVFNEGQYAPETSAGKHLLAHELTHVVQQAGGTNAVQRDGKDEEKETLIDKHKGKTVYGIVINASNHRVAFLTNSGFSIRGSVTDFSLKPGSYVVHPDYANQQWIFDSKQIAPGERFDVDLDDAMPWTLSYTDPLTVTVTNGFSEDDKNTKMDTIKNEVIDLIDNKQSVAALELLSSLNEADLSDLLAVLQYESVFAVMNLARSLPLAERMGVDTSTLLLALDAVAHTEDELYIDNFNKYYVDPASFGPPDPEREKLGKWNIRLVFSYDLDPARAVTMFADDISDVEGATPAPRTYGPGGLLYPPSFNKGTLPRMWAAKKEAIAKIEEQNMEFIKVSNDAAQTVINLTLLAQSLMTTTYPAATNPAAATRAGGLKRPVTEAFKREPGQWTDDFQGGANMKPEDLAYEARVCNKDPAIGYDRNGTHFDGYDEGKLIDAKNYTSDSGMTKSLQKNSYFIGNKTLDTARKQLRAADGVPVEWRVASEEATAKLQQLFKAHDININVVFVP